MRLYGKIVSLLDLALKGVQVVMGDLNALNVSARGAYEVVVVVIGVEDLVPLHSIKDIDLREDLVVRQKVELSIDSCLVY